MIITTFDPNKNPELIDRFMPALVGLLASESPDISSEDIDTNHVKRLLLTGGVVALLAMEADALVGCAVIGSGPAWYNPKKIGVKDLLVWTHPAKRGEGIATALIAAIEDLARLRGFDRVYLSQSTGIGVAETSQLYQRLGYKVSGFMSSKRMN